MPLYLALLWLALGFPTLECSIFPENWGAFSHSSIHPQAVQRDDKKSDQVDEWRRREILQLDGREKITGSSLDRNVSPYVLLVVVPLLGFIILVALLRMGDF